MIVDICLKPLAEGGDILFLHRQSGGVSVSAEVFEKVAAALYGVVDVESRHAACRSRCHAIDNGEHHCWTEVELGES